MELQTKYFNIQFSIFNFINKCAYCKIPEIYRDESKDWLNIYSPCQRSREGEGDCERFYELSVSAAGRQRRHFPPGRGSQQWTWRLPPPGRWTSCPSHQPSPALLILIFIIGKKFADQFMLVTKAKEICYFCNKSILIGILIQMLFSECMITPGWIVSSLVEMKLLWNSQEFLRSSDLRFLPRRPQVWKYLQISDN